MAGLSLTKKRRVFLATPIYIQNGKEKLDKKQGEGGKKRGKKKEKVKKKNGKRKIGGKKKRCEPLLVSNGLHNYQKAFVTKLE